MKKLIDCNTCKSPRAMKPTKVSRFHGMVVFIGYCIAIPSFFGFLFAVLMFFSTGNAANEVIEAAGSDAERAGATIGAGIGFGFSMFVGVSSLVGGLVGWLIIAKKKVFKCISCGFILDRA